MTEPFISVFDQKVMTPDTPPRPIVPSTASAAWPLARPENTGVTRPFVNAEQNSRLAGELSPGPWRIRWQTPLTDSMYPAWVLATGDRILVEGESIWELFDRDGSSIRYFAFGPATVLLDPERGVFYSIGEAGEIGVRDLATAEHRYRFTLTFGQAYARVYLARIGDAFVAASVAQIMDPHKPEPNTSMVEIADLPENPRLNAALFNKAFAPISAHLYQKSRVMKAATRGTAVVLATQNQLSYADLQLKLKRVFSGEFVPISLSVDEGGRAYLLVDAGRRRALWVVMPNGERVAEVELPEPAQSADHPPIVGYDHSIYIIGNDRIYAFGPNGEPLWVSASGPRPAGATITANGWLLASIGNRVVGFDPIGQAEVLHTFEGEQLETAPILDDQGDLLVASRTTLFCLSRK